MKMKKNASTSIKLEKLHDNRELNIMKKLNDLAHLMNLKKK